MARDTVTDDCEMCGTHAELTALPLGKPSNQSGYSLKHDGRMQLRTWLCKGCWNEWREIVRAVALRQKK